MRTCRHFVLFLLAVALMATNAHSADTSANEAAKDLMAVEKGTTLHPWNASVGLTWLPDSDIRSVGRVGMQEVEASFGRSHSFSPDFTLSTDFAYSVRKLDAPETARLPEALHALSVKFAANYQFSSDTTLTFLVAPGLNGDFRQIGTDSIRTEIGVMGRYTMSSTLTLLAGAIFLQGYESIPALPIIGAIYRPSEEWTLSLAAPRPGVTYSPDRTSSYYISGEFAGAEYQLHDPAVGAKIVRYRDMRLLAGAEYLLFSALKLNIAGGYAFDRKFNFYDGSRDDVEMDDGPFARLGVSLVW